jgi:ATP-dependent Clp protease ATP-binding subunit ClpA
MYERFGEAARQIVVLGQEEARQLDHAYVGTEHLLLGVITYGSGIASRVLADLGVTAPAVRELVVEIVGRGTSPSPQTIPFTPRARSSFELAWNQARDRGADQVGPEHLLLGLLDDGHGVAGQIVTKLAESTDAVRRKLEQRMDRRRRSEAIVAETVTRLSSEESAEWSTYGRRHHLLAELNALLDENERLHEQVAALRNLLRRHDIDPDS